MNYLNQYKIPPLNTMHQNHFANQTSQSCSTRFHHSAAPAAIVDRIVFPPMVNDVR